MGDRHQSPFGSPSGVRHPKRAGHFQDVSEVHGLQATMPSPVRSKDVIPAAGILRTVLPRACDRAATVQTCTDARPRLLFHL